MCVVPIFFNMKRLLLLTALLIAGLLFPGCGERSSLSMIGEGDTLLEFDKYVESVSITEIMASGDILLGDVSKAVMADDSTCILMDREQRALIKMASDGRIIDKFQRLGRGPQEYIEMHDFDIDINDKQIYMLCNDAPSQVLVIDLDFNLEKVITFDRESIYERIAFFEDRWYLYSFNAGTVFTLDENDNLQPLIRSERSTEGLFFSHSSVFHKTGNVMLIIMSGDDVIYKVENDRPEKFYTLNWRDKKKRYRILSEMFNNSSYNNIEYAKNAPPSIDNMIADDRNIIIFYNRILCRMAVVDIATGEVLHDGIICNTLNNGYPKFDINDNPSEYFFVSDSLDNRGFYTINYWRNSSADAMLVKYKLKKM